MGKYCKLILVSDQNNNKFYIMDEQNGQIHIEYGRIDHTSTKLTKPLREWDLIYKSKVKKGYKDVTDLVTEKTLVTESSKTDDIDSLADVSDKKVNEFLQLMERYTSGLVKNTYSVTYKNVTPEQVKAAQTLIDELVKMDIKDEKAVNDKLIELYTVIPRAMRNVKLNILPAIDFIKALEKEQDNIDAMSSQVEMYEQEKANNKQNKDVVVKKKQTMLDVLGITMSEAKDTSELKYLLDQVGGRNRVNGIFEVNNPKEDKIYEEWLKKQKNTQSRILIHGTRCSSVLSILKTSLKIRPNGNFQFSGKVYGEGSYFSEVVSKSLNYTGYDPDKILLVYEVHTGNPFIYDGWYRGNSFNLTYGELQKRGYDSTYVKAGNGLLNSEIIAYKEEQYRIKYIIWLK